MTYYEERDDIKKKLSQLLEMEKKKVEELRRELKTLPDGEIVVKKNGEGFFRLTAFNTNANTEEAMQRLWEIYA